MFRGPSEPIGQLWSSHGDVDVTSCGGLPGRLRGGPRLYRAYLLKEGLRHKFSTTGKKANRPETGGILGTPLPHPGVRRDGGLHRAPPRGDRRRPRPHHGLSRTDRIPNTKIRLLTRIAFGFRSAEALIALAVLALGGHQPRTTGPHQTATDESVSAEKARS